MLSIVSSIFDSLGFMSPVTLGAKAIIQKICNIKIGWDDKIPEKCREEWQKWLERLTDLKKVAMRRFFRSMDSVKIKTFSCIYFVMTLSWDTKHARTCELLMKMTKYPDPS
jgi:hypothetical protein